jgi:hypothetical protein
LNSSVPISNKQPPWLRLIHPRETIEFAVLIMSFLAILGLHHHFGHPSAGPLTVAVTIWATCKTVYYFGETLWHLIQATASDLAYHRFLVLMAYNMAEVTLSFALDFYCLCRLNPLSMEGIREGLSASELLFECLYFSILNFSFFGYGNILPVTTAAKFVMLLEVVTAFTTVIFLISDFVSMKESMKRENHGFRKENR